MDMATDMGMRRRSDCGGGLGVNIFGLGRRNTVAHFARKVRATVTSRGCFGFAIGALRVRYKPSLCGEAL